MQQLFNFLNFISPISQATWEHIRVFFQEVKLEKQQYFAREGEIATQVGLITQGVLRAFYRNREGQEYNKHFFVPLSLAGAYSSLVSGQPNQINQQALSSCTLLVADYRQLTQSYEHFPDLERLARRLAERYFVEKEQREIELVLLNATERYHLFRERYPGLEQLIPQYHIASYLGVTPTQLSRIRAQ